MSFNGKVISSKKNLNYKGKVSGSLFDLSKMSRNAPSLRYPIIVKTLPHIEFHPDMSYQSFKRAFVEFESERELKCQNASYPEQI